MKARLTLLAVLAVILPACSSGALRATIQPQTPASGQIIFGTGEIDGPGATITDVATCLNPSFPFQYLAHFVDATDGHVDLMVVRDGGAPRLLKSYQLIGGLYTLSDGFHPFDFDGSARYTFTVVLAGRTIATGTLSVDSWPPTQCENEPSGLASVT